MNDFSERTQYFNGMKFRGVITLLNNYNYLGRFDFKDSQKNIYIT